MGVHTSFASGFTGASGAGNYTARLEIGVEVFFVISGFLLYRNFAVEHFGGRPAPGRRQFWVRRLKRIIPAYWVAFIGATYVLHADRLPHHAPWYTPLIYLGFAQIYFPHYTLGGLAQAWSLCTEMTFYLMIPLYAAALFRRRRDRIAQLRVELAGLAVLVAVSLAWRIPALAWSWDHSTHQPVGAVVTGPAHSPYTSLMTNWLPAYLDQFALGMLLAVFSAYLAADDRRPGWLWSSRMPWISWSLAALAFVAVSNIGLKITPVTVEPAGLSVARQTLYGLFAFFVVAPAVFGQQDLTLPRRLLRWRPVALVGVVSYGVYLWHEAWVTLFLSWFGRGLFQEPPLVMFVVVAGLAIAAATGSYLLVERPVLHWHRRPAVPTPSSGDSTAGPHTDSRGTSAATVSANVLQPTGAPA